MTRLAVMMLVLLLAAPAAAQQRPRGAAAPPRDESQRYRQCLQRAEQHPAETYADATGWARNGGGDPARHCAALALLHGGRAREAAEELERLATNWHRARPVLRSEVLGQAGRAWIDAGDPTRANAVLTTAIELVPANIELYVDRAEALAAGHAYWEAIDDLNRVLEMNPRRAEAYAMRASAYRHVESLDLAAQDAEQAVTIDPALAEGWLERGIIFRLNGQLREARAAWARALLLDPDGPVGETVRTNIERLELRLDEAPPAPPAPPAPRP